MLNKNIVVNLRLFDGEGETPSGSEGQAANTSQQTQSEVIVYGKGEVQDESSSQTVNTDANAQASQPTPEDRAANFKKLIEEYKDEYTDHFNRHVSNRFKEYKTLETKASTLEPIVNTIMKYYGVETVEDLSKIIDDDMLSEIAANEGFTDVEKYKKAKADEKDAELFRNAQKDDETKKQTQAKVDDWLNQGSKLKETLPEFDFHKESENQEFLNLLESGFSVEKAYKVVHMDDIIRSASATAAKNAEKNVIQDIQSNGQRLKENGTKPTPGVIRKIDPSKFTEADFLEIERRAARGEKIVL